MPKARLRPIQRLDGPLDPLQAPDPRARLPASRGVQRPSGRRRTRRQSQCGLRACFSLLDRHRRAPGGANVDGLPGRRSASAGAGGARGRSPRRQPRRSTPRVAARGWRRAPKNRSRRDHGSTTQPRLAVLDHLRRRHKGGTLPANVADRLRYPDEVVDRVRELARERSDEDIAAALNQEGRSSAKGEVFNVSMVRWIRYKHRIPAPDFQRPGESSVRQVADELGVSRSVVYYWIDRGVITARRRNHGSPYWITFDDDTKEALRSEPCAGGHRRIGPR